jgi:hypothetical protein
MSCIRTISDRLFSLGTALALCFTLGLLTACNGTSMIHRVVDEKPMPYAVAVATGCIDSRGRPAVPILLKDRYTPTQWAAMAPGAKAFAVAAQAGRRLTYEELDRAATAGCTVAKPAPVDNLPPK